MEGEKVKKETNMKTQSYENMSDTCALNKGRSKRINDLEGLGSWDCGMELGSSEQ